MLKNLNFVLRGSRVPKKILKGGVVMSYSCFRHLWLEYKG